MKNSKTDIFSQARTCVKCADLLPYPPNPVIQGNGNSQICVIGHAPGLRAHQTSMPFNDASGDRLRTWLGINKDKFYDEDLVAILPMSFCYPGKGVSGDLPPIKCCAPTWHDAILQHMQPSITLLVGKFAQDYYLQERHTLTERVRRWQDFLPVFLVLPHPSPRNNIWLKKNTWFEQHVLPDMRQVLKTQCDGL
ncbi:uracil-DNA glycosylase family protein [Aliiglaciecola sp. LCG003]|uniref:uracil-DNA glycosylase family protein n=1 Tax=Aliiglaciecola sp. LCG003 TaxID=3053655 RepID=UPI0025733597|nr:uracil-DNA glycosylase family protein [Aliiglaciecola sp. LCG003]WJG09931.1 uracil-DNA glycosylase family protein [Aliiglaciecola sp. LCG003]